MSEPTDMAQLVKSLPTRPRGKACIVLTQDHNGQKEWARELARQTGSEHLDLLDLFAGDTLLASKISQFTVSRLFDFLKDRSSAPILIISGLEFLKATWSGQTNSMEQFASRVETWYGKPCLLFLLQYDKLIATREFKRFSQHPFVVDQKETLAL